MQVDFYIVSKFTGPGTAVLHPLAPRADALSAPEEKNK